MQRLLPAFAVALALQPLIAAANVILHADSAPSEVAVQAYALPSGGGYPHDIAVGADGIVWYTAQHDGQLGRLEPASGKIDLIPLGAGAAPHGVIVGPDGAPWITDAGGNAILRVDPQTREVKRWPLPVSRGDANLNTAAFDKRGRIWFTGQSGIYGRLDPESGDMRVWDAPRGRGPYGITATPTGDIYYASLAGNYIAHVDPDTGAATVIEPPTENQGARRVWSDSHGRIWVSEWNAGSLGCYDPKTRTWRTWKLPGADPHAYAVYVDDKDMVWASDWGANAVVRFDPVTEKFDVFANDRDNAGVRQINGRPGEIWVPESGADRIVVYRTK
jgi:virginiamycin B lyase